MSEIIHNNHPASYWYYYDGMQVVGPLDQETLGKLHSAQIIDNDTQVRNSTEEAWIPFGELISQKSNKPIQLPHAAKLPPVPTATPEANDVQARKFEISFKPSFIPSTWGFQGNGEIVIRSNSIECTGDKGIPLFVDCIIKITLIAALFIASGVFHQSRILFTLVAVACYKFMNHLLSQRHSIEWERSQLNNLRRNGKKISFSALHPNTGRNTRLSFLTVNKEAAVEIEKLIKAPTT